VKKLLGSSSVIALALMASTQSASAQSEDAEAGDSSIIMVTAQRLEQSIQDVPISVQPVSAEELDQRGIDDLTQLTVAAPTLQLGGDNTFAVRGVGTQIFTQSVDPSVAIAFDEVNYANLQMSGVPFNDIERIEVLNGPQGLLFGKNASAGLLNIVTRRPELGYLGGEVSAEYQLRDATPGNSSGYELRGVLNIPTGDNSALRVSGIFNDQDPIIEDLLPINGRNEGGLERWGVKAKYLLESGPVTVYLIADYNENAGVGGLFERTYLEVDANSPDIPGLLADDGIVAGPENLFKNSDGEYFRDLETGGVQGTISYEFDSGLEIANIMAWRFFDRFQNLDTDFTSGDALNVNSSNTEFTQFSNETRLVLPSNGPLTGQVGLYVLDSKLDFDSILNVNLFFPSFVSGGFPFCVGATVEQGPPPACPVSNVSLLGSDRMFTIETTSLAAFGQFNYEVSDSLSLLAGARVTRDEISIDGVQNMRDYAFGAFGAPGSFAETTKNTNFSYKVGGQYDIAENAMIFATYGRGYKAPGFNDGIIGPNIPLAVDDEISKTFEIGLRSEFLDDMLIFNVTAFDTKFKDYQSQAFNLTSQSFSIQNAASVTSRGVELDVTLNPVDGLSISWVAAFLDSEYDDFPGAECYPGQTDASCAVNNTFNAAGSATPLAADFTSTLQAVYEFALGSSADAYVQGNWYTRSSINFGQNGSPDTLLDGIDTFGISAGVRLDNGLSLSVFCRNCTNELVPTAIGYDAGDALDGFVTTRQSWGYNSTRTIGASASFEF